MKNYFDMETLSNRKDPKKFWSLYKTVVKTRKSKDSQTISNIINENGESLTDQVKIANTFNSAFTNIKVDRVVAIKECEEHIDNTFLNLKRENKVVVPNTFSFGFISAEAIISAIERLDTCSSAGITEIPVAVIKKSATTLAPILAYLFNECISAGRFPSSLKQAIVTPLFKKGDATSCDNYRGISVLSPFAKIFERIMSNHILSYFSSNNLFCANQHGFRRGFSCETALQQSILDDWKSHLDNKETVLSLFVDFRKAFDLVHHELLLRKLFHYGFDNTSIALIRDYFWERSQTTRVGKQLSDKADIKLGVPQGSILGPLFFLIYINDLSYFSDLNLALFADDTTAYEFGVDFEDAKSKFLKKFSMLYEWINYNHMFINWSKTKFMIITKSRIKKPSEICLENNPVEVVKEFKLLGCNIDENISLSCHVEAVRKTVLKKIFAIKKLFFLPFHSKLQFFKTFILPHFDYCSSLFIYMSKTLINKIERLYNFAIFVILNIKLNFLDINEQPAILTPLNLFPFKYRLLYRFSLFSYRILNNHILKDVRGKLEKKSYTREFRPSITTYIFDEPFCRTIFGSKRISFFLTKFVNKVIKTSYTENFSIFKRYILDNISELFVLFDNIL
jgi:hypothetical protein